MPRFAVLKDSYVVNVIMADALEIAEVVSEKTCMQTPIGNIGDFWDGVNFISPDLPGV
jgi:hypothetical protein